MSLAHFVTHKISKELQDPAATLVCSEQEADLNNDAAAHFYAQTAAQLKGVFTQRSGKRYGAFHPEITYVRAQVQDWLGERQSFLALTRRISKHLADSLDNSEHEVEGYLAFFMEKLADHDRFYCFLLRRKSSVMINSDMSLTETHYLDFSNTGLGFMFNISDFQLQDDSKYLTFSYGRGDKALQNHWADALGFTDTLNTSAETEVFLDIVDEFSHTLPAEQSFEYKTKVVNYCLEQDLRGEPVVIDELADYLANEVKAEPAQAFSHYFIDKQKERLQAAQKNLTPEQLVAQGTHPQDLAEAIKTELIPDRKKLRGFIRYSGKNKDLSLSFSADLLDKQDITFDPHSNELRIHKIPESLLKQLKP
ncbi:MAG: nucleoid-associated protein [Venatoribacter sp.]